MSEYGNPGPMMSIIYQIGFKAYVSMWRLLHRVPFVSAYLKRKYEREQDELLRSGERVTTFVFPKRK